MENRKEMFEEPEMEIVELDKVDVLTNSGDPTFVGSCQVA